MVIGSLVAAWPLIQRLPYGPRRLFVVVLLSVAIVVPIAYAAASDRTRVAHRERQRAS